MASLLSGDAAVKADRNSVRVVPAIPVPAYSDIAKQANDILNKDFYHVAAANLDVKSKAPNGVNFTVKGRSAHDGPLTGSLEAKKIDKPNGITGTVGWSTFNTIDGKIELDGTLAKDFKVEGLTTFKPETSDTSAKVNFIFKQPAFHVRAFVDALKGPTANIDAVIGHEGLVAGAEAGYDVQKAAVTRYSASAGYIAPEYSASVTATNNFNIFTASYFHKVNSQVQAGAKTTYDSKNASTIGLEVAGKYVIDPLSFVKGKVNDRGVAAVSYSTKVNSGFTLGLGASFDTQKLNEGSHKVGANFAFEG